MNKNIMKTAAKQIMSVQRMLWQLDRTIFIMLVLETIIDAVLPFIGIYLSAYVLDGLTLGQSMSTLIVTSTVVVGVIFVLTLLRAWMEKIYQTRRFACWKNFDKCLAIRTLTMDYELLESPSVNELRNRVRNDNNSQCYGTIAGVVQLTAFHYIFDNYFVASFSGERTIH